MTIKNLFTIYYTHFITHFRIIITPYLHIIYMQL